MKPWLRGLLIALGAFLFLPLVGPFLVPVPPLEGVVLPQELADPDSRFVEVGGITVHRIVPTEQSIRLAGELPRAELRVIPDCGHIPQEECPGPFLQAVKAFLLPFRRPLP
jgi:hypothetical protein